MIHAVEVEAAGVANTVQDLGRAGHRALGVPVSGAADAVLLACANRLLGNAPGDAAIELPLHGPSLRAVAGPVQVALMGDVAAQVVHASGQQHTLAAAHTLTLRRGDLLRVGAVRSGVAYLALSGGCAVPPQMGSRSTYVRAGIGGLDGRALQAGDRIACAAPRGEDGRQWRAEPFVHAGGPVRVLLGPQDDAFDPAVVQTFLGSAYRVGRDSDRMGMRLQGPLLVHRHGADLTSEGVVPGAVQVPGDGAPIVLLADAQTVGGYTKIATVIRADLPRLAHRRAGDTLRFAAVSRAEALLARQAQQVALAQWAQGIVPYLPAGVVDLDALWTCNLVSGAIDARAGPAPQG